MSRAVILRLLVAAALTGLIWAALDGGEALARLGAASPGWLLAALAALTVQTLLSAWRWRLLARWLGVELRPGRAVSEYYLSQIVNQALPGGVVGDVGRAVRSAESAGLLRAGQAVVLDRLTGNAMLLAVLGVAAATVTILPGDHGLPPALPLRVLAGLALLVCAVPGLVWLVGRLSGRTMLPGRMRRRLAELRPALNADAPTRGLLTRLAILSLGTVMANLAAFLFAARATGTALPPAVALIMLPLILAAMLLPVTVSGWGLREGAAAVLFPMAGFSAEAGLAASVAFGLVFLVASLPGLAVMLWPRRRNAAGSGGLGNGGKAVEHP